MRRAFAGDAETSAIRTRRLSWENSRSPRPSHRHCRHRCERPLRMDAPSTGWVTALAGLLARGSPLQVRPAFPVSQWPSWTRSSPLTVAGAATVCRQTTGPCSLFRPQPSRRGTSTAKMWRGRSARVKRRLTSRMRRTSFFTRSQAATPRDANVRQSMRGLGQQPGLIIGVDAVDRQHD
jgi:hypothetical protein